MPKGLTFVPEISSQLVTEVGNVEWDNKDKRIKLNKQITRLVKWQKY